MSLSGDCQGFVARLDKSAGGVRAAGMTIRLHSQDGRLTLFSTQGASLDAC